MTREKFRHTDEIQKYREKLETNLKQYQGEILKKDQRISYLEGERDNAANEAARVANTLKVDLTAAQLSNSNLQATVDELRAELAHKKDEED